MTTNKRSRAAFEADFQAQQSPYVFFGSPLPPLDPDVRDDGTYVPVWKQEVTDERGRKRLHGAFTGGFSAGYFNTVGSKEGWAPSSFVSSRQNRAKDAKQQTQQRPEDFMDEEDLREAEESRKLQVNATFAGFGSTEDDSVRLGALMDIMKIGGETMGVKLLKRMGWREGQGIGPKIRRKAILDDGDENEDADADGTHLFSPENVQMISFDRKDDFKGLGYTGEIGLTRQDPSRSRADRPQISADESDEESGPRLTSTRPKKKKQPKRGGFGVGVLNDTGSDDEDPYQIGPQISYNRVIGGDKKKKIPQAIKSIGSSANPLLKSKPVFVSRKAAAATSQNSGFRRGHDGRFPLDGFVMPCLSANSSLRSNEIQKYRFPDVPKDWKSSRSPKPTNSAAYFSTADAAKASSLNPAARAALLGETLLPGKSVFDFMNPQARDRIAALTGRTNLPPALSEKAPQSDSTAGEQRESWNLVPRLDQDIATQALSRGGSGWMPYAEDETKRSRYRSYLETQAGLRHDLPDRAPGNSTQDWVKEMQEFAHAARMFKPMTGMMASRFTTSSSQPKLASDAPEPSDGRPLLSKPAATTEDPAEAAAKIGMYGSMTRSIQQFYPSRLLCKRFNVKPPAHVQMDPGNDPQASGLDDLSGRQNTSNSKLELVSRDVVNRMMLESGGGVQKLNAQPGASEQPKHVEVDPEHNEALEAERPGEAVFKAIFGSDEEEEEEEE